VINRGILLSSPVACFMSYPAGHHPISENDLQTQLNCARPARSEHCVGTGYVRSGIAEAETSAGISAWIGEGIVAARTSKRVGDIRVPRTYPSSAENE
jgi:hypothetical protein